MSKHIFKNKKGGVTILHYVDGSKKSLKECIGNTRAKGARIRELPDSVDLSDRSFRDAWDIDTANYIKVDVAKARDIIRVARNRSLEVLDKEAMAEARKPVSSMVKIDEKAKMLRDIPQSEEFLSDDVEVLKVVLSKAKGE